MTTAASTSADVAAILAREDERCKAISNQDWATLETILTDDLTHIHMPGRQEDKPTYLAGVKNNPRTVTRDDLQVRVYGDTAIMTGAMTNARADREDHARVTQVW